MIGHKLGEFSHTRQFHGHTAASDKKVENQQVRLKGDYYVYHSEEQQDWNRFAQKVRQVCDLVRDKKVLRLKVLRFCQKREIAIVLTKLLNSGLAVARNSEI